MSGSDTDANEKVSRRNVLRSAGGFLAGSTALASLGTGRAAALPDRRGPIRAEVLELTEAYVAVRVGLQEGTFDEIKPLNDVVLGEAGRFLVHGDGEWVSLPEDTDGLATPVEISRRDVVRGSSDVLYFRTEAVLGPADRRIPLERDEDLAPLEVDDDLAPRLVEDDFAPLPVDDESAGDGREELVLGLGVFPERTVPAEYYDTAVLTREGR